MKQGLAGWQECGSVLAVSHSVIDETAHLPARPSRLLILMDDHAILTPMAQYLRGRRHDVVVASEAEEAEALLDHEPFDLLVLDLALSRFGRSGLEVLRSIHAAHPWLPIVALSAEGSADAEQEATRLGADAVLAAPQPLANLARAVEALVAIRR